jgi:protein-S-isoprenylcysteine O-methyltransferase Ste14
MGATDWEFKNRAMIFGMIFGCTFPLYVIDPQNTAAELANWLGARIGRDPEPLAHVIFISAAVLLAVAALLRTWASAYLNARVVYASEVKSALLVADGPYRHLRNPLYLANVLMAISLGAMESRLGFIVAVAAMLLFCYRLIWREEADLRASQGDRYATYCKAVPRLWPSIRPRIASAASSAEWQAGFRAEFWYWGFALALTVFAVTFNLTLFFAIFTLSIGAFWAVSWITQKRANP